MKLRSAAAIAAALALTFSVSGCNFMTPQATLVQYDPSDGVSGTSGMVEAHNVLLVSDPAEPGIASVLVTFVNPGPATTLQLRVGDADVQQVRIDSGRTAYGFEDNQILALLPTDSVAGQNVNVSMQADGSEPVGLAVPLLTTDFLDYEQYGPVLPTNTAGPVTDDVLENDAEPTETAAP